MSAALVRIPNDEYFAHPAISKTSLDLINDSPASYAYWKNVGKKKTPAMEIGSAVHCGVLEPELFDALYVKAPSFKRTTKAGKAAYSEWLLTNGGKTALAPKDFELVTGIVDAVRSNSAARTVFSNGDAELAAFWTDAIDGVNCKAKFDYVNWKMRLLVDLKTAESVRADKFFKALLERRYHVQLAFYLDGLNAVAPECGVHTGAIIAVEKHPPYHVACYHLPAELIERGRDEYRRNLSTYARCLKTREWPGLPEEFVELPIPAWFRKEAS